MPGTHRRDSLGEDRVDTVIMRALPAEVPAKIKQRVLELRATLKEVHDSLDGLDGSEAHEIRSKIASELEKPERCLLL